MLIRGPVVLGTTSACAENTPLSADCTRLSRNYLRVRGEYPRVIANRIDGGGTTSACAENTLIHCQAHIAKGNYLRVRGEYAWLMNSRNPARELPPRARRIHIGNNPHTVKLGTTSACAENTGVGLFTLGFGGNYLRVRGEYLGRSPSPYRQKELPPRARRIHGTLERIALWLGTTSACAENTGIGDFSGFAEGNYLRVRGEYPTDPFAATLTGELPPRARRIP